MLLERKMWTPPDGYSKIVVLSPFRACGVHWVIVEGHGSTRLVWCPKETFGTRCFFCEMQERHLGMKPYWAMVKKVLIPVSAAFGQSNPKIDYWLTSPNIRDRIIDAHPDFSLIHSTIARAVRICRKGEGRLTTYNIMPPYSDQVVPVLGKVEFEEIPCPGYFHTRDLFFEAYGETVPPSLSDFDYQMIAS